MNFKAFGLYFYENILKHFMLSCLKKEVLFEDVTNTRSNLLKFSAPFNVYGLF